MNTRTILVVLISILTLGSCDSIVDSNDSGGYAYVSRFHAWCVNLGVLDAAWGGCIAEYQIPPDELRQLRIEAGRNPDDPVFIPGKPL